MPPGGAPISNSRAHKNNINVLACLFVCVAALLSIKASAEFNVSCNICTCRHVVVVVVTVDELEELDT